MALSSEKLTALQSQGLNWVKQTELGLARIGGAGPTDHKALNFAGQTLMIPLINEHVHNSPFKAVLTDDEEQVLIFENEKMLGAVHTPGKPRFYDLSTRDGVPYWKIATLHSHDVLATTVLQTCVRYRNRDTSCQFCAIEESLKTGKTIAEKTPAQLAEVARAAVELDGVKQLVMTTGTPKTLDRGAAVLAECAREVRRQVDIPIQAQCEPPDCDSWFGALKEAGVNALGMHLEAVSDRVRRDIMPGKASVPLTRYESAFKAAVAVFGRGNVSTYILAGLGDTEKEIIDVSLNLIAIGVYPFIVPFVPVGGTPLEKHSKPSADMLDRIFRVVGPKLYESGMTSASLKAGCAKCGACSSLKSYEKEASHGLKKVRVC